MPTFRPASIGFFLLALAVPAALAATPFSYRTQWKGPDGKDRRVIIDGTASAGELSGDVDVGGIVVRIMATVEPDGSLSGIIQRLDGRQLGTFTGRRDPDEILRGTVTVGSQVHSWSAPSAALPRSADTP